jgi:hypothetical protein
MDGDTFQPRPSERAGDAPVPSVARPPPPTAPSKFSGLIDRDCAFDSRDRLPRCSPRPLNAGMSPLRLRSSSLFQLNVHIEYQRMGWWQEHSLLHECRNAPDASVTA